MTRVAVTHAFRTPIGKFMGALESLSAVELGIAVVRPMLERAGVSGDDVDQLIFGNGRQAGSGPAPARAPAPAPAPRSRAPCWA